MPGNAEHGEHCVAGELLCRAPEPLDLGIDQLEELSLKLADVLRIQPLAERGRPGEVGEENGYDPPFLTVVARLTGTASVIPEGDAAVGAEGRAGRLLESAGGASPLERCAALTAKTGARSVLGSAGSADQCHAASLRRPLFLGLSTTLVARPSGLRSRSADAKPVFSSKARERGVFVSDVARPQDPASAHACSPPFYPEGSFASRPCGGSR